MGKTVQGSCEYMGKDVMRLYRKLILSVLITGMAAIFAGCGIHTAPGREENHAAQIVNAEFPVTIENYNSEGKKVSTVYQKPPTRIIALWQNSIETLLELGAGEQIIAATGIDDERHLTEENRILFRQLPMTVPRTIGQEKALAMNPDFILGWLFDFTGKANSVGTWDFWHQRNVPVYMTLTNMADFSEKHVIEDELKYISDVGKIVGKNRKAEEIIGKIQKDLQIKMEKVKDSPKRQKVLIINSLSKGLYIYTPRTLAGDIVTRLGGDVIGKEAEDVGNEEILSFESLMMEEPDVIFIQSVPERNENILQGVYGHPAFRQVPAVLNKRVYTIPFYTIRCPAVRVSDAIDIFYRGLYPEDV